MNEPLNMLLTPFSLIIAVLIPLAGVGTHLVVVEARSPEKLVAWAKGIYACVWIWALAVALPKLAILGFYLRFFKSPYERAISYVLMFVTVATFVAVGLTATFQCTPVSYQWARTTPGTQGKCIEVTTFYDWMSFPNIVTDVVMLVLPLPMIYRLQLSRRQKIGLAVIFATGGVYVTSHFLPLNIHRSLKLASRGVITSCFRFANFYNHNAFEDNTWTSVQLLKWTDIEPGIYFLAACMPSFAPLFQRAWNRFVAPHVKLSRKKTKGTSQANSDNGVFALYTIGGGRRDRGLGHSNSRVVGGFSRLSEDMDEEAIDEEYRGGHGILEDRPRQNPSNREIRVTSTFTVNHV